MRSSRSGSETRRRHKDVRVRLDEDEIAIFDAEVARLGFHGPHGRGDWLRAQLGLAPPPDPASRDAGHQRVPIPGGHAILAELGKAGTGLQKLGNLLPAIPHGYLDDKDEERVRGRLAAWIEEAVERATDAIDLVRAHFDDRGAA